MLSKVFVTLFFYLLYHISLSKFFPPKAYLVFWFEVSVSEAFQKNLIYTFGFYSYESRQKKKFVRTRVVCGRTCIRFGQKSSLGDDCTKLIFIIYQTRPDNKPLWISQISMWSSMIEPEGRALFVCVTALTCLGFLLIGYDVRIFPHVQMSISEHSWMGNTGFSFSLLPLACSTLFPISFEENIH